MSESAAFVCPRGHRHYEGAAFCTVCGAGPVLPASDAARRFRKKPVVVEAVQWDGQNRADLVAFVGDALDEAWSVGGYCFVNTLEGRMNAYVGDWIVKGVQGEFYPVKPDIFEETYEPAA